MLLCPSCSAELAARPGREGSVYVCGTCPGVAAPRPALAARLDAAAIDGLWLRARKTSWRNGRPCPACQEPMAKIGLRRAAGEVVVEGCDRCAMFWFASDEFRLRPFDAAQGLRPAGAVPVAPPAPVAASAPPDPLRPPRPTIATGRLDRVLKTGVRHDDEFFEEVDPLERGNLGGLAGLPVVVGAPESDARPWVTWSIATAIIGLLLALTVYGFRRRGLEGVGDAWWRAIVDWGFVPADAFRHGGATWFTSFFVHAGWAHSVVNAYILVIVGEALEPAAGWRRFLAVLAVSSVAGDLADLVSRPSSTVPSVGASGGIAGLLAYFALALPRARIGFMVAGLGRVSSQRFFRVNVPVRWVFGLWFAWEVLSTSSRHDGVAHQAHVGGAIAGLAYWVLTRTRAAVADAPPSPVARR